MPSERNYAQVEEMRKRGFILVSEAARRMHVHPGVIYRALESERLTGTQIGERKYIAWQSFCTYAGALAGKIDAVPAEDAATPPARRGVPKKTAQRSRSK